MTASSAARCAAESERRNFQADQGPTTSTDRALSTAQRLCLILGVALAVIQPTTMRAAEPIKIGVVAPLTGPLADAGRYGVQGAKLAVEEVNKAGGVLGRELELVIEDDQSLNPSTVLAFTKLADDQNIVAFLGPTRSTQIQSIAPSVKQAGRPVMIGGTDPSLTQAGNPWFFRFRPNDTYTARVMSDYGLNKLGKKKWAIVHATDAFGTNAKTLFVEALKKQSVEPVMVEGQPNNSPDYTAVALAVKQSGADVLATFITFESDVAIFARQLRQLGVNVVWLGSPSITTTTARKLAGASLYGTFAVADFHPTPIRRRNRSLKDTWRATRPRPISLRPSPTMRSMSWPSQLLTRAARTPKRSERRFSP